MGLDTVEIVMALEDEFDIALPEEDVARVHTVADVAAAILRRLPRDYGKRPGCATARAFYKIRRLMTEHAGVERRRIRVATPLQTLFPPGRANAWRKLRQIEGALPRLTQNARAETALKYATAIGLGSTVILGIATGTLLSGAAAIAAGVLFVAIFGAALIWFASVSARHFPRDVVTVGDVARLIADIESPGQGPGDRLIAQVRVLEKVRHIVADELGMPLEKVKPESNFYRDLGMR